MSAGNVVVYQHAVGDIFGALFDADSSTVVVALVAGAYTPSYSSHSSYTADVSAHEVTAFGTKILQNVSFSKVSDSYWVFDADDVTMSASTANQAKYAVAYLQGTGRPLYYVDLETGQTSGVSAQEIVVKWAAAANEGIFRVKNSAT